MSLARTYVIGFTLSGWHLWLAILTVVVLVGAIKQRRLRRELSKDLDRWPFSEEGRP